MSNIKREKLSKLEAQKLREFVGDCVFSNTVFPPTQIGASGTRIQELIHERTVESLGKYADFLETQGGKISRLEKINMVQEKKISGSNTTYSEAVSMIDLIIKHKLYEEYKEKISRRKKEIKDELDSLKTPKERKLELEKELESMN